MFTCSGGGIGRHATFRSWCPQGHAGSSPALSTNFLNEGSLSDAGFFDFLIDPKSMGILSQKRLQITLVDSAFYRE